MKKVPETDSRWSLNWGRTSHLHSTLVMWKPLVRSIIARTGREGSMRCSSTERAFPRLTVGYGSVQSVASLAVLSKVEMNKEFILYSNLFPVPVSNSSSPFTSLFGKRTVERYEQSPFSYESNTQHVENGPINLSFNWMSRVWPRPLREILRYTRRQLEISLGSLCQVSYSEN